MRSRREGRRGIDHDNPNTDAKKLEDVETS